MNSGRCRIRGYETGSGFDWRSEQGSEWGSTNGKETEGVKEKK